MEFSNALSVVSLARMASSAMIKLDPAVSCQPAT